MSSNVNSDQDSSQGNFFLTYSL